MKPVRNPRPARAFSCLLLLHCEAAGKAALLQLPIDFEHFAALARFMLGTFLSFSNRMLQISYSRGAGARGLIAGSSTCLGIFFCLSGWQASAAHASGFLIRDQSAAALGRASALNAAPQDSAAVWENPAGLVFLPRVGASANVGLAQVSNRFQPQAGGDLVQGEAQYRVSPTLFAHLNLPSRIALGLGLYAPFGLAVDWPRNWQGADYAHRTDLQVFAINPVLALRILPQLSVAVGASARYGEVQLAANLPSAPPSPGGQVNLRGSAWAESANIALLYRPFPDVLQFSLSYHSQSELNFRGNANFELMRPGSENLYPAQAVSAGFVLPALVSWSMFVRPLRTLGVGIDLTWAEFSALEQITIDFENPKTPDRSNQTHARDTWGLRVGAEWSATPALRLRAGALLEQAAEPPEALAPSMPDGRRLGGSLGVGYKFGRVRVDFGYMLTRLLPALAHTTKERDRQGPDGVYDAWLQQFALGVGFER